MSQKNVLKGTSQEIEKRIDAIKNSLMAKHTGDQLIYTGCKCNCGGNSQCIFKVRMKNGAIVAIEPDDRYNPGVGMEDKVLTQKDLVKARIQRRGCPPAFVWQKHLYSQNRILYPLRRIGKRGEGRFERITWDEALEIIAAKMSECKQKYGPYSIIASYPNWPPIARTFFTYLGAGCDTWGWCSKDPERLAAFLMFGSPGWGSYGTSSAADMLVNPRLIVNIGWDNTKDHAGPGHTTAWYMRMAKERGTPIIYIDPRYSAAAELYADQWIPIKPGTDIALILAMANVLFKEGLWDKDYVAKYVETQGFEKWRRYVLGIDLGPDGRIDRTPEWAEEICAVPAETIHELARLCANRKPTWICVWRSVNRKSRGENCARALVALNAMLGCIGRPGGGLNLATFGNWPIPPCKVPLSETPPKDAYNPPPICRSHYWAKAVLLLDKVKNGEMSREEWRSIVGYRGPEDLAIPEDFNPKMIWTGTYGGASGNTVVTACNSANEQIKAMEKMDLVVYLRNRIDSTAKYADIVLPWRDWMWEQKQVFMHEYGGWSFLSYLPGMVKPPGEVKQEEWIYAKLAEKLGIGGNKIFRFYTSDDDWDEDWLRYNRIGYQGFAVLAEKEGWKVPSWEEFSNGNYGGIAFEEFHEDPFHGYGNRFTNIDKDYKPFETRSGKIEVYSWIVADEEQRGKEHFDHLGRKVDNLANDWRDLQPLPVYQPSIRGMEDPVVKKYPLYMLTSHSRYRIHSIFWDSPYLRGDVYEHRIWINVADAKARGIKESDLVRVYNDMGEGILPAYVTSLITPGVVLIRDGAWYEPDAAGVDRGVCPNIFTGSDLQSHTCAPLATTLVQIEKTT